MRARSFSNALAYRGLGLQGGFWSAVNPAADHRWAGAPPSPRPGGSAGAPVRSQSRPGVRVGRDARVSSRARHRERPDRRLLGPTSGSVGRLLIRRRPFHLQAVPRPLLQRQQAVSAAADALCSTPTGVTPVGQGRVVAPCSASADVIDREQAIAIRGDARVRVAEPGLAAYDRPTLARSSWCRISAPGGT